MAEAELCVSTSRPLPKPKPAGSRWTLHAGERQVQEDRAPRVDSHSPRFNPQTYPLSFPSKRKSLVRRPFCHSLYPSLLPPSASVLLPLLGPGPVGLNCSLYRFSHCSQPPSLDCSRAHHLCVLYYIYIFAKSQPKSLWIMFSAQEAHDIRGSPPSKPNMLGVGAVMSRETFLPRKASAEFLSSIPRSLLHPQTPPDSTSGSPVVKHEGMYLSQLRILVKTRQKQVPETG